MKKFGIFAACAVSAALCLALFGCGGGAKEEADDDVIPASSTPAPAATTPDPAPAASSDPAPAATTTDNPFVTTWQMLSGVVAGEEYTASMLTQANQMGMGVDFVISPDGTYQFINAGNVLMHGTWTGDANGLELKDSSGDTATCKIKGSILSWESSNGDNAKFSKKAQ